MYLLKSLFIEKNNNTFVTEGVGPFRLLEKTVRLKKERKRLCELELASKRRQKADKIANFQTMFSK